MPPDRTINLCDQERPYKFGDIGMFLLVKHGITQIDPGNSSGLQHYHSAVKEYTQIRFRKNDK